MFSTGEASHKAILCRVNLLVHCRHADMLIKLIRERMQQGIPVDWQVRAQPPVGRGLSIQVHVPGSSLPLHA